MKIIRLMLLFLLLALLLFFYFPNPKRGFRQLYPKQDAPLQAFEKFRSNPLKSIQQGDYNWLYLATGQGQEAILFLHGMGGAYDIWWQQINAFKDSFRIIAPTYPTVETMKDLAAGIQAILASEELNEVHVIGSSLGGDLAQYIAAYHPELVKSAVFGNTFVAEPGFKALAEPMFAPLKWAPEWLSMYIFRKGVRETHYPASQNSVFLKAYLLEQGYGAMSGQQFASRALCVLDIYPKRLSKDIPVLIIEADNDPLVPENFRAKVRETYPGADIHTFSQTGHFPYLSHPDAYNEVIREHLRR